MNWVLILVSILAALLLGFAIFVSKESLKKFRMYEQFISLDGYHRKILFTWNGDRKGKMRNIVIRCDSPFQLLVDFNFPFGGIDFFGTCKSYGVDGAHYAVVSTFLWSPIKLIFEINTPNERTWTSIGLQDEETKDLPVSLICPPHFYQKLHLWS